VELTNRLGWLRRYRRPILFLVLVAMLGANLLFSRSRSDSVYTGICLAAVVGSSLALALLWKGTRAVLRRPCHFTVRQLMVFVGLIAVGLAVCVNYVDVVHPRIKRACTYWRFTSDDSRRQRLKLAPFPLTVPMTSDGVELSTGYASMTIPAGWSVSILGRRPEAKIVVLESSDGDGFRLWTPITWTEYSELLVQGCGLSDDEGSWLMREIAADPFSWEVEAVDVETKSIWNVFAMSRNEFFRHRLQLMRKLDHSGIESGAGVFSAAHVRGMVRFGRDGKPGSLTATIFSTERPIVQYIDASFASKQEAMERFLNLIATYRYILGLPTESSQNEQGSKPPTEGAGPSDGK
jgi:hypothetical protein